MQALVIVVLELTTLVSGALLIGTQYGWQTGLGVGLLAWWVKSAA